VSEESVALDQDASPERTRYRVLLEITDLIAHAKSLPEAFKELAPRVLALTGCELLTSPTTTRAGTACSRSIGKRTGKVESSTLSRSTKRRAGGHGTSGDDHHSGTECEQRFHGCVPVLRDHGVRSYTVLP